MPYSIRKQKCKQSDGDSGSYTLSYTDNKGKKHRACHTSRKKARGQIAAIEGPREGAESGVGEASLREAIRYLLSEEEAAASNSPPAQLQIDMSKIKLKKASIFTWQNVLLIYKQLQPTLKSKLESSAEQIQDVIDNGPNNDNKNGELAVVAALNIFGRSEGIAERKSTGSGHDLVLKNDLDRIGLVQGNYEVKTFNDQLALSRLGAAKAVSVASQQPFVSLARLGRKYFTIIVRGKFSNAEINTAVGGAQEALKAFFEGEFTDAKSKKRYQNMMGLQLSAGAVNDFRTGTFFDEFQKVISALEKAGLAGPEGSDTDKIKLTSSPLGSSGEKTYEFDPKTWDLQVQPYLSSKMGLDSAQSTKETRELREALREMWGVIRDEFKSIQELKGPSFWDTLAEKTQEDDIQGLLAVNATGVTLYNFPELTVKSIVEQGRLELEPKAVNPANEAVQAEGSRLLLTLIKELVRHAK